MESIYLHDIPLNEAKAHLETTLRDAGLWNRLGMEEIPLNEQALGRTIAEPVWAKLSSPHYHASAMDGFAVRASTTAGAMPNSPVSLICQANPPQATYVDTGDPLPAWADAVIPIEQVESITPSGKAAKKARQPEVIRIRLAVTPWSHVRPMGEDIVTTQLVLPGGHVLRPVDLGAIAAAGYDRLMVARKPRVAILPTGTELVEIGTPVTPGDIIEYNSIVLAAQVNNWGGIASRFPIIPDQLEAIQLAVKQAAIHHDLVLLNAGSSAGSEDYSATVIQSLGELLVHGVAIRPGHPVILGMINLEEESRRVPIIGVPGYPVSAILTGEIFVEPLLAMWLGKSPAEPETIQATLTRKVTSPPGDDDYLRVVVGRVGERLLAAPLSRGAGVITSLARADGILLLPRGTQGLPAGTPVTIRLYCPSSDLERTIFAIGSHDLILDLLSQYLAQHQRRLTSANVGSLGGLVAIRREEAHLAGSHLLDPESGEYNLSYVHTYLPNLPVKIMAFVLREQGLLLPKGNPKHIQILDDLIRSDVRFINRQRGAGTRVLLDYQLNLKGIAGTQIQGYNDEEYTHLAVAAAVASGRADVSLGIAAAAQALSLDFIPLYQERYDLIIPKRFYDSKLLEPLFMVLQDPAFRQAVGKLPGYDLTPMGTLVAEME
jgi:putative molybdopterin biosynthesis protein